MDITPQVLRRGPTAEAFGDLLVQMATHPSNVRSAVITTIVGRLNASREELKKARRKAKLTQEQLAFEAGISRNYVSLLERNEKSPTVDVLIRLCQAMDVSAGRFILKVEKVK